MFVVDLFIFILALSVVMPDCYQESVRCVDEENNAVDWYVIYKLPKIKASDNVLIRNGLAYLYMTSNASKGWVLSSKSVNSTDSLPGRTMSQLYESCSNQNSSLLWLIYNDEPVNGTSSLDLGHTKGVVVANMDGGFWLVHSVPKFPPVPCTSQMYGYPATGLHYGQSFFCISMAAKSLDIVAQKKWIEAAPWFHIATLTSMKGDSFWSFAKSRHFGEDLYADLVAPNLKSDLFVESWQNGEGKLPSECQSDFIVENIAAVTCNTGKSQVVEFHSSKDHSKWTVTSNNSNPWVCIGDINRMESQKKRGGGTVCISNKDLWIAYKSTVQSVDSCPVAQDFNNKASYMEKQATVYLLLFIFIYNIMI
ncbi:deoxyribonuclease-2-alpha isoform X3 [Schistocerca piceifrons]|uniref:deoxyribonuclease-2-alpha isoform X3 n=1 Tax=Schistocerca piceifrons TaxID=274613 RepID=UPI001F5F8D98|nr:deoxyribonuclease-2-alpha isoform X3 [Schistocerca piceifrons]